MKLSEIRDRLQDEFEERDPPIQWDTFMLGKVAQLEEENEALMELLEDGRDVISRMRHKLGEVGMWETILGRIDALLTPSDTPVEDSQAQS